MPDNIRLEKLKKTFVESRGNMGKAMIAAGFSAAYAKNPYQLVATKAYQKAMRPLLDRYQEALDDALEGMKRTQGKAVYGDFSAAVDRVQKQIQLITGKATDQTKVVFFPSDVLEKHGIDASTEANSPEPEQIQSGELRS